jgi:hypothetical protein
MIPTPGFQRKLWIPKIYRSFTGNCLILPFDEFQNHANGSKIAPVFGRNAEWVKSGRKTGENRAKFGFDGS